MATIVLSVVEYDFSVDLDGSSLPDATKRASFTTMSSSDVIRFDISTGDVFLAIKDGSGSVAFDLTVEYQSDLFRHPSSIGATSGPRTNAWSVPELSGVDFRIVGPFSPLKFARPDGLISLTQESVVGAGSSSMAAFRPRYGTG